MHRSNASTFFSPFFTTLAFVMLAAVGTVQAQVCVRVDEARDTLSPKDRAAAVLQLSHEFERMGRRIVPDCPTPYLLSHIGLGNFITVTLSGAEGQREGTAHGLEDLPALYNQLVRSLVTGRNVVDRATVTASQASALRIHSDSFLYVRLGYGSIFAGRIYAKPAFGLGYRIEQDSYAIDVSALNVSIDTYNGYSATQSADAGSLLKLEAVRFVHPRANATPYFGGGISYGEASLGTDAYFFNSSRKASSRWHGSGIQGELTAGYEFARTTTLRMFVQADASAPFYKVTSQTFSTSGSVLTTNRRYVPSIVLSVGLGWRKGR